MQITAPKSRTVSSHPPFPAERRKPQQRSKVDSVREFTRGEIFHTELTGKFRSENLELHLKIWMKLKVAPNSRSTFLAGSAQCSTHTLKPRRSSKDFDDVLLDCKTTYKAHYSYKQTKQDEGSNWSCTSSMVREPPPYHECEEVDQKEDLRIPCALLRGAAAVWFMLLCMLCGMY